MSSSNEPSTQRVENHPNSKRYVVDPTIYNEDLIGDTEKFNQYLKKFTRFQKIAAAKSSGLDFFVESSVQHIIALDDIVILKPDQACNDLRCLFSEQELSNTSNHFRSYFGIDDEVLDAVLERQSKTSIVVSY